MPENENPGFETEDHVRMLIHIAVILNIDRLPQLKGKGKAHGTERANGIEWFADALTDHLIKAGIQLPKRPTRRAHTTPGPDAG